jgi:hypothetical protein
LKGDYCEFSHDWSDQSNNVSKHWMWIYLPDITMHNIVVFLTVMLVSSGLHVLPERLMLLW